MVRILGTHALVDDANNVAVARLLGGAKDLVFGGVKPAKLEHAIRGEIPELLLRPSGPKQKRLRLARQLRLFLAGSLFWHTS